MNLDDFFSKVFGAKHTWNPVSKVKNRIWFITIVFWILNNGEPEKPRARWGEDEKPRGGWEEDEKPRERDEGRMINQGGGMRAGWKKI